MSGRYHPGKFKGTMSKRVEMKHADTGRKITVALDISSNEMLIDGVLVERKPEWEKRSGELVFGASLARSDEMYVIQRDALNTIRKMWGLPEI